MSDANSPSPDQPRPPVEGSFPHPPADPPILPGEGKPPISEDVLIAEVLPDPPQLWPVFVVGTFAIVAAMIISGVVMVVVAIATGVLGWPPRPEQLQAWLAELANSKAGLAVLILPGQLTFAAVALGAAAWSPEPWSTRLGLGVGRLRVRTWPLFLLGTPIIGTISSLFISRFAGEPSEHLKMLEQMFQFRSASSLVALLLLVSVVPGFVEELLFRGYMQRRMLTRLPAITSIGICSAFFAAAHLDPMHAVAVLPLGIWLGIVAWRADSVWPAIFGHIGNNAFAIVMTALIGPVPDVERANPLSLVLLGLSVCGFVGAVTVLSAPGARRPGETGPVARTAIPPRVEGPPGTDEIG